VALVNGRYIALGFVFPQVTHMAFKKDRDPDRMIERHTSDHYRTIDSEANFEQYHPGKAWFKIAEGDKLAHEDLTGRDFDGRWELTHNESRTGGAFSEVIVQKGRILLQCVSASGVSSIEITPGTVTISASQEIVNLAPKIIEGTPSHITTGVHIDSNGVHTSGP
jgi:hypothetical protein